MKNIIFISGIDTDSGKTIVTGLIAKYFLSKGKTVITQKLVQTGCAEFADDILTHRKIMGIDLLPEDTNHITCPFIFKHPSSPELSASLENKIIDIEKINENTRLLSGKYDVVLLEGAGGLMVPITDDKMIIDIIKDNQYPLILVSCPKLGSINHTLLSLELCLKRGIHVSGVVYNNFPVVDVHILNNTRIVIKKYLTDKIPEVFFAEIPCIEMDSVPVINFDCIRFN